MDRLTSILLVAGLGCFALAFLLSGWYPYSITDAKYPMATLEEVARDITPEFRQLAVQYPEAFSEMPGAEGCLTPRELEELPADDPQRETSEAAWREAHQWALREGRDRYIAEGCWHCHSQYVRPAANEVQRYGPVQSSNHDNNVLQRPVLWGTRRVGPDLTWEGGKRTNDWHVAHLWEPKSTSPDSIMPRFPWLFDEGWVVRRRIAPDAAERGGLDPQTSYLVPGVHATQADAEAAMAAHRQSLPDILADEGERLFVERGRGPNVDGLALIAYLQWLGTYDNDIPEAQ